MPKQSYQTSTSSPRKCVKGQFLPGRTPRQRPIRRSAQGPKRLPATRCHPYREPSRQHEQACRSIAPQKEIEDGIASGDRRARHGTQPAPVFRLPPRPFRRHRRNMRNQGLQIGSADFPAETGASFAARLRSRDPAASMARARHSVAANDIRRATRRSAAGGAARTEGPRLPHSFSGGLPRHLSGRRTPDRAQQWQIEPGIRRWWATFRSRCRKSGLRGMRRQRLFPRRPRSDLALAGYDAEEIRASRARMAGEQWFAAGDARMDHPFAVRFRRQRVGQDAGIGAGHDELYSPTSARRVERQPRPWRNRGAAEPGPVSGGKAPRQSDSDDALRTRRPPATPAHQTRACRKPAKAPPDHLRRRPTK